jgi:ribonuclease HII
MTKAGQDYPNYLWHKNKGYPTMKHKMAIREFGLSPHHRKSFNYNIQLKIDF